MQSTASTWFCTLCGAANDLGQSVCFSCNRARPDFAISNTPSDDAEGLLLGRYRLLSQVGVGGFGEVYRALDTQHGQRVVAIKQINLRGLSPQKTIEATDTFNRELHILSPLKHPNLPRIYDHFTDPDHWYLVMEFLEGETLERYLEERQRQRSYAGAGTPGLLSLEEIFALAFQLCDVLDYLHAQQPPIIFRDLKPANIMRSGMGHICLIDFGIARFFTAGRAKDTTPLGSPGYAAPEQYGKAQTTARSDLYSLGALLHYLLTGNDPSETPFQFTPLPQLLPTSLDGTRELQTLILRMVDVDSSQRPASAREVKQELQRVANLVAESTAPRIWTPPPSLPPDPRVEGALQQQVQIQIQQHRATTRRKFIRRSLLAGSAVIVGGGLIGTLFNSLFEPNRFGYPDAHSMPQDADNFGGQENVTDIALSPDGKQLALITLNSRAPWGGSSHTSNSLYVYPAQQGQAYTFNTGERKIDTFAWSPDSKFIALSTGDGTIQKLDTVDKRLAHAYTVPSGPVELMAWSPNGTLIASSSLQEALRINNATDGSVVSSYSGNYVINNRFFSWSPDSTRIVTRYDAPDTQDQAKLQVWDVQAGKTLFTFANTDMLQVAWSPDGNTIASLSINGLLSLYNALNGKSIKSYVIEGINAGGKSLRPPQLLWSLESQYLALDNGSPELQVWNINNHHTRSIPTGLGTPRAMLWLPNGRITIIDATQNTRAVDVSDL